MRYLLVLTLAITILFSTTALAQPPAAFADASIHSIYFCDAAEGWAVGDDGVIWHSIDGGTNWERQKSGCRASLRGVYFVTPYSGWAVGRVESAVGTSVGIMLKTTDGGLHWEEVGMNALPGLNFVRFFDEQRGIVGGDGSDGLGMGLFITTDAGKSWMPLKGPRTPSWRAAACYSALETLVGGSWSRLGKFDGGTFVEADIDPLSGRTIHAIAIDLVPDVKSIVPAFAVGDGGMVMRTRDRGRSWGFIDLGQPPAVLANCDFHCVASAAAHIWVAGRPGGFVLHSGDYGKTWEFQPTGLPTPIHAMQFISESVGWAVGDLGVILGTTDSGKTWKVQRAGGQRAAVLLMHSSGKRAPLETVAALGMSEGYLCAAVSMTAADPQTAEPRRAADDARLRAAMRMAGGAAGETVWSLPLPAHVAGLSPMELMAVWDRTHGGKAAEQLLRQAVLAIRMWQPEVIITDVVARDASAEDVLVLHAAREAFKQASDPTAFPEQITILKLQPWSAKKLYALSPEGPAAPVQLDHTLFDRKLGDSPKDFAEASLRLMNAGSLPTGRRCYKLVAHRLPGAELQPGLMDGIVLGRGGPARRAEVSPLENPAINEREAAARTRRHLEGLANVEDTELAGSDKVIAALGLEIKRMPDDTAARTAFTVAAQFVRAGKWEEACEVYRLVVEKYPGHPLAIEAFRWLTRYHSSTEARRRVEIQQRMSYKTIEFEAVPGASGRVIPVHGVGTPAATANVTEDAYRLFSPDMIYRWHQSCLDLEPQLAAFGPVYAHDPAAWLNFFAARRQVGKHAEAEAAVAAYFKRMNAPTLGADPWRDCLAAELWLINPASMPVSPKPLGYCRFTETRPFLDGKLDEPCWANLKTLPLKVTATTSTAPDEVKAFADSYKTDARFAYDDKFLYIAVSCNHPSGKQAPPAAKRGRDSDLRGHDRVDILLDMDRDYQTYYRFQIDHRGCLAEDCWGDKTWNPKYSVAFHPTDTGWTAELAIPLVELTGDRPSHGRTWAVNVSRVVPGLGIQAWSGPAEDEPRPEGMGLLQFRAER